MYRKSTDLEYYRDGRVVIDADGIPVNLGYRGTGSPEGKVSAPVGSVYTDTAATNGAIRWIKASGTGNSGWRVEYGDTGWRDITSLHAPSSPLTAGAGAKIAIRRKNNIIFFRVVGTMTMNAIFGNIVTAPVGFIPDVDTNSPAARGATLRNTRYWVRLEDGTNGVTLVESGRAVETTWSTTAAWPATLPGAPF